MSISFYRQTACSTIPLVVAFCCMIVSPHQILAEDLDARLTREFQDEIRPLLKVHCGECHMDGANEAGVNLEDYDSLNKIREHESSWEQIRGVVRADAMPPPEHSKLSADDRKRLADWIRSALHDVDCQCNVPTPPITIRRLNRIEYDNTVRDLLGVDLVPSQDVAFLSDDVGNGFDNQGEVLSTPPIMLEKFLQAATLISKNVIELDREKMRTQRFDGSATFFGTTQTIEAYLAAGQYDTSVRMRFGDRQKDHAYVVVSFNGETIRELDVYTNTKSYDFEVTAKPGLNKLTIDYVWDEFPERRSDSNRRLFVDSVRFKGPHQGQPCFPRIHEQLVTAYPEQKDTPEGHLIGPVEAAKRVFARFLPKAYRRPVTDEELAAVVSICEKAQQAGFSYLESLQYGLTATLVSPQFLFRAESKATNQPLDAHALASRLSYFLWSTMPDEELRNLADDGTLCQPCVLREQVQRMLDSPRSYALIQGFFGQWLGLRNINKIDIDRNKFLGWNDRLRSAMIKETELFCAEVLAKGTIDDLLHANYTFVNPRLAEFYGVLFDGQNPAEMYPQSTRSNDGLKRVRMYERETEWVKVALPANRKGILTQASVLTLTSNPTRSSPVKRGKWILETILGDPPPSAPPNVPTLESAKAAEGAPLRQRLEIHRSNPSCAGCHKIMDPIGLGLENFDAIGRWRDKEDSHFIDATGQLADGTTFGTTTELIEILGRRSDQLVENLSRRMMIYALGRGLQRQDRCAVNQVIEYINNHGRTVRSLVEAIVLSDPFLQNPTITPRPSPIDE